MNYKNKITIYPNDDLNRHIVEAAKASGLSVSSFIEIILNNHFGIKSDRNELTNKIQTEIEEYIDTINVGNIFRFNEASGTLRTLDDRHLKASICNQIFNSLDCIVKTDKKCNGRYYKKIK